jgi:hypothetical protein
MLDSLRPFGSPDLHRIQRTVGRRGIDPFKDTTNPAPEDQSHPGSYELTSGVKECAWGIVRHAALIWRTLSKHEELVNLLPQLSLIMRIRRWVDLQQSQQIQTEKIIARTNVVPIGQGCGGCSMIEQARQGEANQ